MIEIMNLTKKYGTEFALNDINLSFPRYGTVAILGQSGCGKTTLLNCISGLIEFEGVVKIDGQIVDFNNDKMMSNIRLNSIGFIFQDFRLFENEIVKENLLFPLETLCNLDEEKKQIKCKDLLKLVGLYGKENQFVSTLSGGEKQRLCIARSLVNDPKIILADEPTGALDGAKSIEIMNIFEKISNRSLVIFVTHDENLAKEYADTIIKMKDGKVIEEVFNAHHNHKMFLPILKNDVSNKKPSISLRFLFKHSFHSFLHKKIRSGVCILATSLGLIGVGIAASISLFISSNIREAYTNLIKEDQVMISTKMNDRNVYGEYAGSFFEVENLAAKNENFIRDAGVIYYGDFENFFPDANFLSIADKTYPTEINGITARNINEFEWLDACDLEFYPRKYSELNNDEICLGLDINTINNFCYFLRIERSIKSLSNYLSTHNCYLVFSFQNDSWEYSDEQIVNLRAFCLQNNLTIYHTNHLWNEYMLEEQMRFPTSDNISEIDYYPWVLKKIPYLFCRNNSEEFLTHSYTDKDFDSYILEIGTNKYFPLLYDGVEFDERKRILVFSNLINSIPLSYLNYFYDCDKNICNPLIGSSKGYVIYPGSLMMGFSDNAYLSFDENDLDEVIDIETNTLLQADETLEYPESVLCGHFTKTLKNGLNFAELLDDKLHGDVPKSLSEIVVSSSILNSNIAHEIGDTIYFGFPINELITPKGIKIKEYKIIPLKVTGYIDDEKPTIYQNYLWLRAFFQIKLGISMFDLQTQTISFSLRDKNQMENSISTLQKAFPQYEIINPLNDINESVNDMCSKVSLVTIAFSLISSITSVLLLTLCAYIQVLESKKEIGLARCIGINKKEANKLIYCHSVFLCGIAFITSSFELVIVSIIISLELTNTFKVILSPLAFVLMLILSIFISFLSGKFISLSLNKKRGIEIAKY